MNARRKSPRLSAGEMEILQMLWRQGPVTLSALEAAWRRLLQAAKVDHCGLHAIRHRAATDIANNPDIPLQVGMSLTGHKTAATYLRYLHSHKEQARDAAERVSRQRLAMLKRPQSDVVPLPRRSRRAHKPGER